MAERPVHEDVTRVLVVEDGLSFAKTLLHAVNGVRTGDHEARVVDVIDQDEALRGVDWDVVDVVLVDAYASDRQRRDRSASIFAGLEVAGALARRSGTGPRVVAYSAVATRPEVHVPLRELPNVVAVYDTEHLLSHLASALWDERPAGGVRPVAAADYAALGIGRRASVTAALERMRSRPDAWELVAQTEPYRTPEPRTRDFVNLQVRPLLDIAQPRYRLAVQVLQRVTRLPA